VATCTARAARTRPSRLERRRRGCASGCAIRAGGFPDRAAHRSLDDDLIAGGVACALGRALLPVHAEALLAVDRRGLLALGGLRLLALALLILVLQRLDEVPGRLAERLRAAGPVALDAVGVRVAVLRLVEHLERLAAAFIALCLIHL